MRFECQGRFRQWCTSILAEGEFVTFGTVDDKISLKKNHFVASIIHLAFDDVGGVRRGHGNKWPSW